VIEMIKATHFFDLLGMDYLQE